MKEFFTTKQTVPPPITTFWLIVMIMALIGLAYLSYKYSRHKGYVRFWKYLQVFQLICLYSWYIGFRVPLANSLPFYHCRLAMFALLLLWDKTPFKQYFALLGTSGAILALGYPVFDPYTFPHITSFSFIIGHYALFVNGLNYLFHYYEKGSLSSLRIVAYTFLMDLALVGINAVTGGNYGLLRNTPFIEDTALWLRYLAVSTVLSACLLLVDRVFRYYAKRSQVASKT